MNKKGLDLVTHEQAKRLKALGFDWKCTHYYDFSGTLYDCVEDNGEYVYNSELDKSTYGFLENGSADPIIDTFENNVCFSAPTLALALKWIRDKKNIPCGVDYVEMHFSLIFYKGHYPNNVVGEFYDKFTQKFDTCEAAESVLLDKLLTLLEKEEKQ